MASSKKPEKYVRDASLPPVKADKNGLTKCRVCGCTEIQPCFPPCMWVHVGPAELTDLCSTCHAAAHAVADWMVEAHRPVALALIREAKILRAKVEGQ